MRAILLIAGLCGMTAACAVTQEDQEVASRRPQALVDAYLIAHGMAASYAESANADPQVVLQLARLDRRAAGAVRDLARLPEGDETATAEAVSALTNYAASQANNAQ